MSDAWHGVFGRCRLQHDCRLDRIRRGARLHDSGSVASIVTVLVLPETGYLAIITPQEGRNQYKCPALQRRWDEENRRMKRRAVMAGPAWNLVGFHITTSHQM